MSKVLVIGIDSLDAVLLSEFEGNLPNFRRLRQEGFQLRSKSVYPPDSHTAWASIYTGCNPARHGIVFFQDPLEKVSATLNQDIDNSVLQGKTFWDLAGKFNRKVCMLFPHLGYPVWPVNGIMVGRSSADTNKFPVQTFPPMLARQNNLSYLNIVKGQPPRGHYHEYIASWTRLIRNETEFGLKMLSEHYWDLAFIFSAGADWIQHTFWMYFDEDDPSYPGDNPYKNAIRDIYVLYDEMVGRFLGSVGSETTTMVLSDHGHGRRPTKLVNINEILRREGLLVPKIKSAHYWDAYYLMESFKGAVTSFINRYTRYGAGHVAMVGLRLFPRVRKLYTAPISIDWDKTVAYVSDLSGIKAYNYGGIMLKAENLQYKDYEGIRDFLIKKLTQLRNPDNGETLVDWVCRREELYSGEYISKFPDIVFQLKEDYGAGWSVHNSLISSCHTHNIMPGSHKIDTPVFFMANLRDREPMREAVTIMDIAPTILDILGIEGDFGFDGKSVFVG